MRTKAEGQGYRKYVGRFDEGLEGFFKLFMAENIPEIKGSRSETLLPQRGPVDNIEVDRSSALSLAKSGRTV
jgi:hypothetical protein